MSYSSVRPVGSFFFALLLVFSLPIIYLISVLSGSLPPLRRYFIISRWSCFMVIAMRWLCGIRYRVIGQQNLPAEPFVILSRHESTWETMAYQLIMPPVAFVLRQNLLNIPFWGWGLRYMSPIAINRESGREALRKIRKQGRQRLQEGFVVVVFPEGTRMAPNERRDYHPGGAWFAKQAGVPIVPVSVNSGRCWPKGSFFKRSGLITVNIGPAFSATSMTISKINHKAQDWIEQSAIA